MAEARREPDMALIDAIARVPDHVVRRSLEGETLVLNLQTGRFHGLNPTGGRMFELLEASGSVREAAVRLAEEYAVDFEEIAPDLASFCADLSERGLIELVEPGAALP